MNYMLLSALLVAAPPTPDQVRFFEAKVRPLLVDHCFKCHGPQKQQAGLRLDSRAALLQGGDTGPAVVPGKPGESLLLRAVRHEGPKMPPKMQLRPEEIAALAEWVKEGAPWPETAVVTGRRPGVITDEDRRWWAFQPLGHPSVPLVRNTQYEIRNDIDRFLLTAMEKRGVTPVEPADRRAFIRRVAFDLIGLPPTPEEVEAFVVDGKPNAAEELVERLLASRAYGERWGRHWLDLVRYADTAGDNSDYPIPQHYRYRDWVIQAFNEDRPYDVFIREQLAGDLMGGATERERRDRLLATGYLANTRRFGSYEDARYQWYLTYEDTIDNLGRTFLGLTVNCSRCHDHKFDPISSEDYYALYGFFQSTRYPWPGIELDKVQRDLVPLAPAQQVAAIALERHQRLKTLAAEIDELAKKKENATLVASKRKELDQIIKSPWPYEVAYVVGEGTRKVGNARMQLRGDPEKPGKEVPRRFLAILGGQPLPADVKGSGRLQLAEWISDARNPLTARVMVNRLWQHHFGRGLVPTPSDFGRQGKPPSHPELLDWLARRFIDSGWSVKAMHRLMVLSSAYRRSSQEHAGNAKIDPDNVTLWKFPRRRLDAEAIRDSLLTLAGALDRSPSGPHPFPAMPTWNFTQHKPFKDEYDSERRSVYLMTQRIQRHSFLGLFDGPDTNASTAQRGSSTTTLQALYLMNNGFVHEQARRFAERLRRERTTDRERVERAFQLAFGRPATDVERSRSLEYLDQVRRKAQTSDRSEGIVWESFARALVLSSEFVYVE